MKHHSLLIALMWLGLSGLFALAVLLLYTTFS